MIADDHRTEHRTEQEEEIELEKIENPHYGEPQKNTRFKTLLTENETIKKSDAVITQQI